jgi:hypothetical protein
MKEMTSVATTMMSDEEKADMARDLKGESVSPAVTPTPSTPEIKVEWTPAGPIPADSAAPGEAAPTTGAAHTDAPPLETRGSALSVPDNGSPTPSASSKEKDPKEKEKELRERRRQKPTPEQKKKLEAMDKARREAMDKRIKDLHQKLVERYGSKSYRHLRTISD